VITHDKWVTVSISSSINPRSVSGAIPVSAADVIIFGGQGSSEKKPLADSFMLSFSGDSLTCSKMGDMVYIDYQILFESGSPQFDGNNVYALDNHRGLHIYSTKDKKWALEKLS